MVKISGGDKLAKALAEISKKVESGGTLSVGFLSGATYPDGTPVALVAATQEYGSASRGIPARPFFRDMIAQHSGEWGDELGKLLVHTDYDVNRSLGQMGARIEGELVQSIKDTNEPALAEATIKRKGSEKPLVDTGHMLASVASEVSDDEI